jgi:hypothetical protein
MAAPVRRIAGGFFNRIGKNEKLSPRVFLECFTRDRAGSALTTRTETRWRRPLARNRRLWTGGSIGLEHRGVQRRAAYCLSRSAAVDSRGAQARRDQAGQGSVVAVPATHRAHGRPETRSAYNLRCHLAEPGCRLAPRLARDDIHSQDARPSDAGTFHFPTNPAPIARRAASPTAL